MKQFFRKSVSALLALSLLGSVSFSAAASNALGEDVTVKETLLHQQTQLSTNVFWSTAYSDLRTENVITYTPSENVTPIVTFGNSLTDRNTVSSMARQLEGEGHRVVAGINGDFYNVGTGLPIGMVVADGQIRSSDGGYYAIGFHADGTAIMGKPALKVSADLGYQLLDSYEVPTQVIRQLSGINKARVSTGGIYLYTYDFNAKHTTGTTEPGVDVVCTIQEGKLSIGGTLTLTVDQVLEGASATPIGENQVVLSVNQQSNSYHIDALRNVPLGTTITLNTTASSEGWNNVENGVGALYALVENGAVSPGLAAGVSPRTAVGQRSDGSLLFYTIDGRRSGYSIGASLTQVAQRLIELGCVTALCLDGGGSTTLSVTEPDEWTAKTINKPSDGGERSVSNQIFLVSDNQPSDHLSHFYVSADYAYVLAGSKVNISASAVDTNYIPMNQSYELEADAGELDGNVLTTPKQGGLVTVTADSGGKTGTTTVNAIADPDNVAVRDAGSAILTTLGVAPGSTTQLSASAAYRHIALKADPEAFTWTVTGDIGTVDQTGKFTATTPGTGTIAVSAGGKSAVVAVTVSKVALKTVEDFESEQTIFTDGNGDSMQFRRVTGSEQVKLGRGAAALDYTLTENLGYSAQWRTYGTAPEISIPYTSLNLWVYGDASGNVLTFLYANDTQENLTLPVTTLDFTGWKQVSVTLPDQHFTLQGLRVSTTGANVYDDGFGNFITDYPDTARAGTVYVDHLVASFGGTVDQEVPAVTAALDQANWQVNATVKDAVDGVLPKSAVSVTYNGSESAFTYDAATGKVTLSLPGPGESYEAMRVTVTAKDASGNIGRSSVDVEPYGVAHKFTDIDGYWAATYVDFLYNSGVTTGYSNGTFQPNQNITRAQFAVMLYRYLGLKESAYADVTLPFADNAAIADYAVPAIKALYTEGIINGSTGPDGKIYFNPGNSLTRAQAATMIGRTQAKGYAAAALSFTDAAKIPAYAAYYIQTMAAQGIIGGYTDGSFKPNSNITRGQMAKILYNLM
ncbi:S-layer homology domain-containing protein [Oscillibacter sp.]|uniref:S-layer homology domain-containing protein n=1 Tax=Oscillibacter sp. TaxID=1945593 RepID=UPI0026358F02|nr:S-layer homology domain-containing protein [Oscillibacter sp.]MDD3347022.1 S-layer homology domain-containing protein [Oscillibacter sp.]